MIKLWKIEECIMSEWLYQIRIKVSEKLSEDLRGVNDLRLSNEIIKIATDNSSRLVCTFDAFAEYCEEAEREGIEQYELYHWTKSTIDNPDKKAKHLKCAIDFLTLHQYLNRRGKIKENEYKFIKKRYLWQYIYYLRINNKNVDMFNNKIYLNT